VTQGGVERPQEPADASGPLWTEVGAAFDAALGRLGTGRSLEEAVSAACGEDALLAREVRSLLVAHARDGAADRVDRAIGPLAGAPFPTQGHRFAHFTVTGELGRGGMAVVYEATEERSGQHIALKVLSPVLAGDPNATSRFRQEVRAAASLVHANICGVLDAGATDDGWLWLAMPRYQGETLAERLERGPLPTGAALRLARDAARGLAHAHGNGVVHRDIKPANLFLLTDGTLRILDFGIAKTGGLAITRTGMVLGTMPYMSPEQAVGRPVDARTDLWALGVVLHECLSGRRPFDGPTPEATLMQILVAEPRPLVGVEGGALAARVVDRLLVKEPEHRLGDASQVVALLDEAITVLERGPARRGADLPRDIVPEGERRFVTVLTVRVAGEWSAADAHGTEVDRGTSSLAEAAAAIADRHGGVLHDSRDGVLQCLFGATLTHEDDPVRAVRAARDIHRWVLSDWIAADGTTAPRVRAGVATGTVKLTPQAGSGGCDASGTALEVAGALADIAPDTTILVAADCARQVAGHFDLRPGRTIAQGGETVVTFEVVGETPAFGYGGQRPVSTDTPFEGRERELAVLSDAVALAESGEGQLVCVEAEAGAGKTRLLHELERAAKSGKARWVRVGCGAAEDGAPAYAPWVSVATALLSPEDGSSPARVASEQLAARVETFLPGLGLLQRALAELLGAGGEEQRKPALAGEERFRHDAVRTAIASLVVASSERQPLILLLEDWHWADAPSHTTLRGLAELLPAHRLCVIVTYRPGHGLRWDETVPRRTVALGPLGEGAVASIAAAMLGAPAIADDLCRTIAERAGGNPFFVEELVRTLQEQGAVHVADGVARPVADSHRAELPGSVQAVIHARLDRLDANAQEAARAAAVLGREFPLGLLASLVAADVVLPLALDRLKHAGLVHQARLVPEPVYRFRHALVQEVAYESLPPPRRRMLHARAGAALAGLGGSDPDRAGHLAHHYAKAEDWTRAVRYGREEARRAVRLHAFTQAVTTLERVLGWCERLADAQERNAECLTTLFELERALEPLGRREEQGALLRRIGALLEAEPNDRTSARLAIREADLQLRLRRYEGARAAYERVLALAAALDDRDIEREARTGLGAAAWLTGQTGVAVDHARAVIAMETAVGGPGRLARAWFNLGSVQRTAGALGDALASFSEAERLAVAVGDVETQAYVHFQQARIHRAWGERARAMELYELSLAKDIRAGLEVQQTWVHLEMAGLRLEAHDFEGAIAHYEEAVRQSRSVLYAETTAVALRCMGEVLQQLGRSVDAVRGFRDAAAEYTRLGDPASAASMLERVADHADASEAHDVAAADWQAVAESRRRAEDLTGTAAALLRRARSLRAMSERHAGDPGASTSAMAAARDAFAQAIEAARTAGAAALEADARNGAGILEWNSGSYVAALEQYDRMAAASEAAGDGERLGLALNSRAATLLCMKRVAEARDAAAGAAIENGRTGQALLEGHAHALLGDAELALGAHAAAREAYERSLAVRRAIGDRRGEGWMLVRLSDVASAEGDPARSLALRASAQTIARSIGDNELLGATTRSTGRASNSH